jgi:molybdate transport system substrate-binding protein
VKQRQPVDHAVTQARMRIRHAPDVIRCAAEMEDEMRMTVMGLAMVLIAAAAPRGAAAAEIKVLTAGAFKQVLLALIPDFEKQTGHKVTVDNDTVGALTKRIDGGEAFDLAVLTPAAVNELSNKGRFVAGSRTNLARVGVGVVVKDGTSKPDIGSVEAFKRALLAAKSVAYIDPAAGGSSGIYVAGLLDKLGVAAEVKPKAKLIPGGAVAEHVARGEAELGIHQISEILPVKGVTLVGPLPADIQNYTVYAAGIGANAKEADAARALLKALSGPTAADVLKSKGMEPAGS